MDYKSLSEIIRSRRSIRIFDNKPVDTALLKEIIGTASHAPSNNNRQGWRFYIVRDRALLEDFSVQIEQKIEESLQSHKSVERLMVSYREHFLHFRKAPAVVVCCFVKPNRIQTELFKTDEENNHMSGELISLSLVIQNMLLLAESRGLGTLVMTSPLVIAREIKAALRIPPKYTIGAFVCFGYYDHRPPAPRHLGIDKILGHS